MRKKSPPSWFVLSSLVGAAVGFLWWLAYTPSPAPLAVLVVVHATVVVALAAVLRALGKRWMTPACLGMSAFLGLVAAPAAVVPLYATGRIWGGVGLAVTAAVALAGLVGGAATGRLAAGRGVGRALAWGGLAVVVGMVTLETIRAWPGAESAAVGCRVLEQNLPDTPVLVLGLDCADWRVLEPHLEAGELPNLARLREQGRHGVLHSQAPMQSPAVWTSIFTGLEREEHGITDWNHSDARDRQAPALWELFDAQGASSLTVNVPGTWPPRALRHGTLVSGFPIPGMAGGERRSLLGAMVSTEGSSGPVRTLRPTAAGDGSFIFELPVAPGSKPRFAGLGHAVLDLALRKHLTGAAAMLRVRATPVDGRVRLRSSAIEGPVEVEIGAWTPWLRARLDGVEAVLRVHAVAAGEGRLSLYVSPPFEAPWKPEHPFVAGLNHPALQDPAAPYVVEGVGWTAFRDGRVAPLAADLLLEMAAVRARAVERIVSSRHPRLTALVMTVTDRTQHAWLPLDRPELYSLPLPPTPGMEGRNPVAAAYRLADRTLGRLRDLVGEDALVMVVSDHGVRPGDRGESAHHRLEGVWIAAGPMVAASAEPMDMELVDVLPTLLHCLGLPVADDLAGAAHEILCPEVSSPPPIATYRLSGGEGGRRLQIDEERREQLRSLGYVD